MAGSLEINKECQICLEDYEESGDHVPRILPCSHSLCEKCLKQLIQGRYVNCPECREKHPVVNGDGTFHQNKYILASIYGKDLGKEETAKCEEHGDRLTLLCKKRECQKAICNKCLKYHRGHVVVDLEEEEQKEALAAKFGMIRLNLQKRKEIIMPAPAAMNKLYSICIEELEANEEQCLQIVRERFELLRNYVEEQKLITHNDIARDIDCLHGQQQLLDNIKKKIEGAEGEIADREDIASNLKMVNSVEETLEKNVSLTKSYEYLEYRPNLDIDKMKGYAELLCGHPDKKKREISGITVVPTTTVKTKVLEYNCTVTKPITTNYVKVDSLALLYDKDLKVLIVLGDKANKRVVTKYDIINSEELGSVNVNKDATGLTEVVFGERSCVAISYWVHERKIEFRDSQDLSTIIKQLSVAQDKPTVLCTAAKQTLYYANWNGTPHFEVKQLSCEGSVPELVTPNTIKLELAVTDMCVTEQELVIVTASVSKRKLDVYNTGGKNKQWSVPDVLDDMEKPISPYAVTLSEKGYLFFWDENNKCVQIFKLNADYRYMGALLKPGDLGIGEPIRLRWYEKMSSLIVVHKVNGKISISVIKSKVN